MNEDRELLADFMVECNENLERFDRDLLVLEQRPGDSEALASAFRAIHTIKGSSGFFGLEKLQALTHAGENVLSLMRDGTLMASQPVITALLGLGDAVRKLIASIEANGKEGEDDAKALKVGLELLANGVAEATLGTSPDEAMLSPRPSFCETSIRVDVKLLDKLMNLVGELVLARNQVLRLTSGSGDNGLTSTTQRLNLITSELQENVMKTRMQPIGSVFGKFPRMVRDVSLALGKEVEFEIEGASTELDRTINEAIKDPLTHLLRNAIDHGIEAPDARRAAGKPSTGRIRLRAFHEGGQVNIEISDDGAGLDPVKIKQRAVQRGLVSPDKAQPMSDRELINLIFLPGFSTAEKVTGISGRGVGMDVVRTNVEGLGGVIDLHGHPGQGTTCRIKIPLTLAIIPALILRLGMERYAIPQASVMEIVHVDSGKAADIKSVYGAPVLKLRGRLLPLIHLDEVFGAGTAAGAEGRTIVVLRAHEVVFGLVVDDVTDTEEIVVKPLGKELKSLAIFAGATIMGDGRVALILDVHGLAENAGLAGPRRTAVEQAGKSASKGEQRQPVVLVRTAKRPRVAIPLSSVARLEELPWSSLERSGGQHVVQYRGDLLPVVPLSKLLGDGDDPEPAPDASVPVVVAAHGPRLVGIAVDRIDDVVEVALTPRRAPGRGLAGTAVVEGKVTDILDTAALIGAFDPSLLDQDEGGAAA